MQPLVGELKKQGLMIDRKRLSQTGRLLSKQSPKLGPWIHRPDLCWLMDNQGPNSIHRGDSAQENTMADDTFHCFPPKRVAGIHRWDFGNMPEMVNTVLSSTHSWWHLQVLFITPPDPHNNPLQLHWFLCLGTCFQYILIPGLLHVLLSAWKAHPSDPSLCLLQACAEMPLSGAIVLTTLLPSFISSPACRVLSLKCYFFDHFLCYSHLFLCTILCLFLLFGLCSAQSKYPLALPMAKWSSWGWGVLTLEFLRPPLINSMVLVAKKLNALPNSLSSTRTDSLFGGTSVCYFPLLFLF